MSWTDERVETLKRMWNEGQSASQIAKELGGVTRNAVIGKVHRLGLSNRVGGAGTPEPEVAAKPQPAGRPEASKPDGAATPSTSRPTSAPRSESPRGDARPATAARSPETSSNAQQTSSPAVVQTGLRKQVIPAGQPLPPQPSANEISAEALASVREVEKKAKKLTLMDLTERTCKWPIGDPATEDFWFCGLSAQPGKPYCEAHVGVAFQPMSSRRDRRR